MLFKLCNVTDESTDKNVAVKRGASGGRQEGWGPGSAPRHSEQEGSGLALDSDVLYKANMAPQPSCWSRVVTVVVAISIAADAAAVVHTSSQGLI